MSVMRIKDENGNWQEVAALTGIQGPEGPAGPAGDTKVFVVNVTDLKKADATAQEILDAVADGCVCILRDLALDHTYTYMGRAINSITNKEEPFFVAPLTQQGTRYLYASIYVGDDGTVTAKGSFVTTPSPFPLKLTGAVEAEFDGSKAVTVDIPEGGGSAVYVTFTTEDGVNWAADKTLAELYEAASNGQGVYMLFDGAVAPAHTINSAFAMFTVSAPDSGDGGAEFVFVLWADNSVIVSEQTGAGGPLLVVSVKSVVDGVVTATHSVDEITSAVGSGRTPMFVYGNAIYHPHSVDAQNNTYTFVEYDVHPEGLITVTTATITGSTVTMGDTLVGPKMQPLTINGVEYDGTQAVEINVEGGSASKYAQPDWGAENTQGYILPETDLYMQHDESSGETLGFVLGEDIQLTEGENYTVTYNGAEYKCAAFVLPEEEETIAIGNAAPFGLENTGEPFLALVPPANNETFAGASLVVGIFDGADAVKMAISSDIEKVYPIPAKYLEAAPKPLIVTVSDDTGKCDTDFNEILEAVRAGRTVLLQYIGATYAMSGADGARITFTFNHNSGPDTQGYCNFYTIESDNTVHFNQYLLGMPI